MLRRTSVGRDDRVTPARKPEASLRLLIIARVGKSPPLAGWSAGTATARHVCVCVSQVCVW